MLGTTKAAPCLDVRAGHWCLLEKGHFSLLRQFFSCAYRQCNNVSCNIKSLLSALLSEVAVALVSNQQLGKQMRPTYSASM